MTVLIQIRIDSNIKKQATELFESLGLDISTAVNIFLYQCVLRGGLPFKIEKPYYNDEVIEAMAEALRISKDVNIKGYKKIDELKQSLTED